MNQTEPVGTCLQSQTADRGQFEECTSAVQRKYLFPLPSSFMNYVEFLYFISRFQTTYFKNLSL